MYFIYFKIPEVTVTVILVVAAWFAVAHGPLVSAAAPAAIGVIGDSISAGAGTHPLLRWDAETLQKIGAGKLDVAPRPEDLALAPGEKVPAPRRPWPTTHELYSPADWIYRNAWHAVAKTYLDTEEYAWASILARTLNVAADEVVIAAEDGARSVHLRNLAFRLILETGNNLPARTFIFLGGNDLCQPDRRLVPTELEFTRTIRDAVVNMAKTASAPVDGAIIYVVHPLRLLQLVDAPAIRAKEIEVNGGKMTCGSLFAEPPAANAPDGKSRGVRSAGVGNLAPVDGESSLAPDFSSIISFLVPPTPALLCGNLPLAARQENVAVDIANRNRSYSAAIEKAINEISAELERAQIRGIAVRHISETSAIQFKAEEIANDCVHLSVAGQRRVAEVIQSSITTQELRH